MAKRFDLESDQRDAEINAQPCQYISVGLRMGGNPDKVREFIRRLGLVGYFEYAPDVCYVNNRFPFGIQAYARISLQRPDGAEALTLYDQLDVAQREINKLEAELGEAWQEVGRLKQELGMRKRPRPFDAVLGGTTPTSAFDEVVEGIVPFED